MNTLKKYKKSARNLFFESVDKDLEKWTNSGNTNDHHSPYYNNTCFIIDRREFFSYLKLSVRGQSIEYSQIICIFKWLIFPLDFKVWYYTKKLKRHFKKLEKDKQDATQITEFKNGLEDVGKNFIKEIRREKLEKIKDSSNEYTNKI